MRKNRIKELTVLCVLSLLGRPAPAYAGWNFQDGLWRYEEQDGSLMSGWLQEADQWYYFEADGHLATGWKEIEGFWYFFNPVSDGSLGRMMTGWQWIDGKCYYLAEVSVDGHERGSMYAGTQAPDGSQVDENGAWTDENGTTVTVPGKGILTREHNKALEKGKSRGRGGGQGSGGYRGGGGGYRGEKESSDAEIKNDDLMEDDEWAREEIPADENESSETNRSDKPENEEQDEKENGGQKASPSDADRWPDEAKVNWQVRFVDADSHQITLAPSQKGVINQGEILTVNFKSKIIDEYDRVWESLEKPPLKLGVYGPGDQIYQVEYRQTGVLTTEEEFAREKGLLRRWLEAAKEWEAQLTGETAERIPDSRFFVWDEKGEEERLLTAAGQISGGSEGVVYVIGKNREPQGTALKKTYGDKVAYSRQVEEVIVIGGERYVVTRFAVDKKGDKENNSHYGSGETGQVHWKIGDVWEGEIDGESYTFRCIDQNYSDKAGNHRQGALFLCDQVIPADFGSFYTYEKKEDGTYGYVFHPGPIVNFGSSNDYKYSRVRKWLKEWEMNFEQAEDVDIGISYAYTGSTSEKAYGQLSGANLRASYIGSQKMTGKLFILSVDEAVKYRDWLWRFDGSDEENPESQYGGFSKGYWLRSPMGTAGEHKTGFVYIVDLTRGNIRPVPVSPTDEPEDEELTVTGAIGVRPVFVMAQDMNIANGYNVE